MGDDLCHRRTCQGSSVAAVLPGAPPVPLYLCSEASCGRTVSFSKAYGSCMGLALLCGLGGMGRQCLSLSCCDAAMRNRIFTCLGSAWLAKPLGWPHFSAIWVASSWMAGCAALTDRAVEATGGIAAGADMTGVLSAMPGVEGTFRPSAASARGACTVCITCA